MLRPGFIAALSDWANDTLAADPDEMEKAFLEFHEKIDLAERFDAVRLSMLFSEWVVFDRRSRVFDDTTGLQYFTNHDPLHVPEADMAAYRDMLDFRVGFFDVEDVAPGSSVALRDADGAYAVADVNASMNMKKGETAWCRIASVSGIYQVVGSTILSAPVTHGSGLKARIARMGKNAIDAREVASFTADMTSPPLAAHPSEAVSEEGAARALDDALRKAGMQDMFSSATVKKWARDESFYPPNFPAKALFFLLPEELPESNRNELMETLTAYLRNLPRSKLKGKTPEQAYAKQPVEERHFELDSFGYDDYAGDLRAAHAQMQSGDNKGAYKSFEKCIKRLLEDKVPAFPAFRIYTNAALCRMQDSGCSDTLGRELIRAALRLNPKYDFGWRQKERCIDPYEDYSGLSKKDAKFAKNMVEWADVNGVRRYRRTVFRRYEDFLSRCGISLTFQTATPTSFYGKEGRIVPGRNDLCPCESGKKYKKCCGPGS